MSSLIPEKPLVISPSLAATIGLEEAILLQLLHELSQYQSGSLQQQFCWHHIELDQLQKQLPFWDIQALQRISTQLSDKGIILIDAARLAQGRQLYFAMNDSSADEKQASQKQTAPAAVNLTPSSRIPSSHNLENHAPQAAGSVAAPPANRGARLLAEDWQPDDDLLQLLALNHGIPRSFALQQLEDFLLYWRDRQQVSHSWPSKFRQHVLKEWRFHQSRRANQEKQQSEQQDIEQRWQPSLDAMEILQRAGINQAFIEDAIPEFVLYWRERGEASNTWNSKFIAHIRRQWARYTASMQEDYEPREIPANWQPSQDAYDILQMANIDLEFARQLVPEFILFWRDTKQIHRSWNSKFLQHAKYQWASRNHYNNQQGITHGGQPGAHSGARTANEYRNSPFKQLTDRSWAQGLVDGL